MTHYAFMPLVILNIQFWKVFTKSASAGKLRFIRYQTSIGPTTSLKTQICLLWSSKKRECSIYPLSWFIRGAPTKLENAFFQKAKLRILMNLEKIHYCLKNSQGKSFKARGLIFRILAIYIHICKN